MGLHPKIGITGLPRSGKSAVMEKVLGMLSEEREREISLRGNHSGKPIIAVSYTHLTLPKKRIL